MGVLVKALKSRSISPENPSYSLSDPAVVDTILGEGDQVSVKKALGYAAVWRGVNLIANYVAKLPLIVYRRVVLPAGEGKTRAVDHPAYRLLRRRPCPEMSAFTLKQILIAHALLRGNGYAYIFRDQYARSSSIVPLDPEQTWPIRYNGEAWYLTKIGEEWRKLPAMDVIHVKGLGWNGLEGFDVLSLLSEQIALGLTLRAYSTTYFENSARAAVVLIHPAKLTEGAIENIRKSWERMHQGLENAHKTAVLTEAMKIQELSAKADDAQVIEQREYELREIANILGLPPHKLGDPNRTSYSSLEQENQAMLDDSLDPWLCNIEEECWEKLLTEDEKADDSVLIEFLRAALVRANLAERYGAYATGIQNSFLEPNEARAMENLNPVEGGNGILKPLNMTNADGDTSAGGGTEEPPVSAPSPQVVAACRKLLLAVLAKAVRRLGVHAAKAAKKPGSFLASVEAMRAEHLPVLREMVEPVAGMIGVSLRRPVDTDAIAEDLANRAEESLFDIAGGARPAELPDQVTRAAARWEAEWPPAMADALLKDPPDAAAIADA